MYVYSFVRDFIPCWRNKEKITGMSTSHICNEYYFVILGNDFTFFIMKIRKSGAQILDCIYEFIWSPKL